MPRYRNSKSRPYSVGDTICIYLKKDTPTKVLDWLSEQEHLSSVIMESIEGIVEGEYIPISSVQKLLQTDKIDLENNKSFKEINFHPTKKIKKSFYIQELLTKVIKYIIQI